MSSLEGTPWKELTTPEGKKYYFNTATQKTAWELPTEVASKQDGKLKSEAEQAKPPESGSGDARSDWEELKTSDGKVYYYNSKSKATTWTKPRELEQQPAGSVGAPAKSMVEERKHRLSLLVTNGQDIISRRKSLKPSDVVDVKGRRASIHPNVDDLRVQLSQITMEKGKLEQEVKVLKEQLESHKHASSRKEAEKDTQLKATKEDLNAAQQAQQVQRNEVQGLKAELESLKKELERERSEKENDKASLSKAAKEIDELKVEIEAMHALLSEKDGQVEKGKECLIKLEQTAQRLEEKENVINTFEKETSEVREQLQRLNKDVLERNEKIKVLESALANAQQNEEACKARAEAVLSDLSEREVAISSLQKELKEMEEKIGESSLAKMSKEVKEKDDTIQELTERLSAVAAVFKEKMSKAILEKEEEIERLERELESARDEDSASEAFHKEKERYENELAQLRKKLEEKEDDLRDYMDDQKRLESEVAELKKRNESSKQDAIVADQKKKILQLEDELAKRKKKAKIYKSRLKEMLAKEGGGSRGKGDDGDGGGRSRSHSVSSSVHDEGEHVTVMDKTRHHFESSGVVMDGGVSGHFENNFRLKFPNLFEIMASNLSLLAPAQSSEQ